MTYEFEYLMNILSCGARGISAQKPKQQLDWDLLLRIADEQSVKPIIAYAVKKSQILYCPEQYRTYMTNYLHGVTISATIRKIAIIKLLDDFEQNNVKAIVLKGFAVAECYAIQECRISGDTDILVSPDDEQKAYNILKDNGFDIETRNSRTHHVSCHHTQMGYLELHVALYGKDDKEIEFRDINEGDIIKEPYIKITTDDGCFYTLGKTDHLIFLAIHMIKHFISSGINLRMVMDIALFYKKNISEIDTRRFWQIIEKLRCCQLLNSLLYTMIYYCGFTKVDFLINNEITDEKVNIILYDIEVCGGMNYTDINRKDGYNMYNREKLLENMSVLKYKYYMTKKFIIEKYRALFPAWKNLAIHYHYISKYPILIPYAWLHRLIFRGISYVFNGNLKTHIINNEDNLSEGGKRRVEMFRKLGMM